MTILPNGEMVCIQSQITHGDHSARHSTFVVLECLEAAEEEAQESEDQEGSGGDLPVRRPF